MFFLLPQNQALKFPLCHAQWSWLCNEILAMSDITPGALQSFVFLFCLLDNRSILCLLCCVFAQTTMTWARGIPCFLTWHYYPFRNSKSFLHSRGFFKCCQQQGNCFSQVGKTVWSEVIFKENFLLGDQTRWAKSSSQLVNLHGVWPLVQTPALTHGQLHVAEARTLTLYSLRVTYRFYFV